MVFRLRHSVELFQHHPLLCDLHLLFLGNAFSFSIPCSGLLSARFKSCPITCYSTSVISPPQLDVQHLPLFDLKCNLLQQEGFAPSQIKGLQCNSYFRAAPFERVASVVCFLRAKGIAGEQAGRILMLTPFILEYKVENMERTCEFLENLGLGSVGLQRILLKEHAHSVLHRKPYSLQKVVDFLQQLGLEKEIMPKLFSSCPKLLFLSVERKMEPTLAFFERYGMNKELFGRLVRLHPQVFGYSIDGSLTGKLEFVRLLGLHPGSAHGARAVRCWITRSPKALVSRWEFLKQQGISDPEISKMVKRHPDILSRAEDVLKRKIEFWKNVLKRDVQLLPTYSSYFTISLENRIIPRLTFLNRSKDSGEVAKELQISPFLNLSDKDFERKFGDGYGNWKAEYLSKGAAERLNGSAA